MTDLEKEVAELKKQIEYQAETIKTQHETINGLNQRMEKMKCCDNCVNQRCSGYEEPCRSCDDWSEWELAE